jgi:hypothetical protein
MDTNYNIIWQFVKQRFGRAGVCSHIACRDADLLCQRFNAVCPFFGNRFIK